ncbi:MAG: hypothetical protein MMC33_009368 [Icmadophila ericetorum]|nr:hypothetical protein [Icmadophila ericetorum]
MSEEAFHTAREVIRKLESCESKAHSGQVPSESESSQLRVLPSSTQTPNPNPKSSPSVKPRCPCPTTYRPQAIRTPPMPQKSMAEVVVVVVYRAILVMVREVRGGGLREPVATGESSVRADWESLRVDAALDEAVGRQGVEVLEGIPQDAKTR